MRGQLALIGGHEHLPGMESVDRMLLRASGVRRPEVAVLLAASPEHRRAFKQAEAQAWWSALGARARCAFAGEPEPDQHAAALVADADLIVLTGGRPWLCRRRLVSTRLGELIRRRWEAGVAVAGSSAGAMVLAAYAWSLLPHAPLSPSPRLGFVPATLVAPHAGRHGINSWAALTQAAHPSLEVLGIPDATAVVVGPDGDRTVVGRGAVMTYGHRSRWRWNSGAVAPAANEPLPSLTAG